MTNPYQWLWKACIIVLSFAVFPSPASSADVVLAGLFADKAVLVVDGGAPRTLAVGQRTPEGVKLVEVSQSSGSAVIEVDGVSRRLVLGGGPVRMGEEAAAQTATLFADGRGHHFTNGTVNGRAVRFLVDTGASMVSIGLSDARRAGINHLSGVPVQAQTASGRATVWRVRLDSVRIGDLTLHGVDALVFENELPFVLLGMSFLNRTEMLREENRLILRKKY